MLVPQAALDEIEQWAFMATNRQQFTAWHRVTYKPLRIGQKAQPERWLSRLPHHHTTQLVLKLETSYVLLFCSSLS